MNHEYAARRHAVSDAKLIEDVGIQNGDVGEDDIGGDQLKVHVRANIARAPVLCRRGRARTRPWSGPA